MNNQKLVIGALIVLAVIALGIFSSHKPDASAPVIGGTTITLTEDGFLPAELQVKVGETVTFVSKLGKPFWPASHPHPSHTIFPEFDPKQAVAADGTWEFTATKVGTWGYHDHLAPYYTGTLIITE